MRTIRKASYTCKEGSSNKEYHFQLVEVGPDQYVVNFQFGGIGTTLKPGTKTKDPVDLKEANKTFEKMKAERLAKRYEGGEEGATDSAYEPGEKVEKKRAKVSPQLLNEVEDIQKYINDPQYCLEEKYDGERRMAIVKSGIGVGVNKKGEEVPLQMEIVNSLSKFDEIIIDGEIIGNRLYAFDLLSLNGKDVAQRPQKERRSLLGAIDLGDDVRVVRTAYTTEEKQKLYDEVRGRDGEGVVVKKISSTYKPGRPATGGDFLKFKFVTTASFIVSGITKGKRSVSLDMIDENGQRVDVGKVTIPPNKLVPEIGDVVEVRYLYAHRGGAIFQSVFLGKRTDVDQGECLTKQLKYKAEVEP